MKIAALAAAALLPALAACTTGSAPPEPHVFVMRHLHKAAGDDPGLTPQGEACAASLASFLSGQRLSGIYASATRRARETAAPVAAASDLTVQDYAPTDAAGVAARARAETGSALIVGHSNTVPDIVERLGGTRPGPIDESRYGELWRVSRGGAVLAMTIPGC